MLLDYGADINLSDPAQKNGRSALTMAAAFGQEAVVRLLLARGADVSTVLHDDGATPLMMALQQQEAGPEFREWNGAE
eukprot:SAG22_NODE_432_length_10559_cov_29.404225_3_plen_78_part_00